MNLHIFKTYGALETLNYELENFPSVYWKRNNNGQYLELSVIFL